MKPEKHQRNLAEDPAVAAELSEMKALLLAEMRKHANPWRLWAQPDDGLVPTVEVAPQKKAKALAK